MQRPVPFYGWIFDLTWLMWIKLRRLRRAQADLLSTEIPVAGDRRSKQGKRTERSATAKPRPAARKGKRTPEEELSPERRVELAQQEEARQFRGKPPSI
jgi:hypothetical protein